MAPNNGPLIEAAVAQASKIDGWMDAVDLRWLSQEASRRKVIVEVGSWLGRSTKAIAMTAPGKVFAVDHWENIPADKFSSDYYKQIIQRIHGRVFDAFCDNLKDEIKAGKCVPIVMDSLSAASRFRDDLESNRPDMVFIDGTHTYESVRDDIRAWKPLVAPGGILCGHDYASWGPGVVQAVGELLPQHQTNSGGSIWYVGIS